MLKQLIRDKIDEIFLEMQDANNINDGGIYPFDALQLEQIEEELAELIERVINYQKGGIQMKQGQLIAVNGVLYDYVGYDEESKLHKVAVVDIDEEGILTSTHNTWYFTNEELKNAKPNLTERQWIRIVETLIRNDYDLTEEEVETAAEDIVCREFAILGVPTVEELNRRIETYMQR